MNALYFIVVYEFTRSFINDHLLSFDCIHSFINVIPDVIKYDDIQSSTTVILHVQQWCKMRFSSTGENRRKKTQSDMQENIFLYLN